MKFKPNKRSIRHHEVPEWFHDAKLGIFVHWGLYSVPAFAITGIDLIESQKRGIEEHFKNNPYAEWYLNSLRIEGTAAQKYHFETYGKDFLYDDFVPMFNEAIKKWNPEEWAETFKKAGAKYVVLVTKHHDGFLLWPSKHPNPKKENYCANRNIVDELSKVIRKKGMKMGFYYSGSLDWSFNPDAIKDAKTFLQNGVRTPEYIEYANNHWLELIDDYKIKILWNDIGYPPFNLYELFAYFYNIIPDGVINDRWHQIREKGKKRSFPTARYKDFLTPEYETFKHIQKRKWEANRGIGNSYGYNKFETEEHHLTSEQLIHLFIDIVSKNGNLLLNVGPMPDGTIPDIQKDRILGLGKWLKMNGEAIYGTRPWIRAEGEASGNIEVRFTQKKNSLYVLFFDKPKTSQIVIKSLIIENTSIVYLLGYEKALKWNQNNENLSIQLPDGLSESPAYSLKISPKPKV